MQIDELICRSLRGHTSELEEGRLFAWRRESHENEAHYRELTRMLEFTETAAPVPPVPSAIQVLHSAESRARPADGSRRWTRRAGAWGSAAAVGIAAAVAFLLLTRPRPGSDDGFSLRAGEFVTGVGETATVTLDDGTVVRLAPESRLRIPSIRGSREVFLKGRAYFAVSRVPDHPFRVRTEAGDAVVLGTRFELRAIGNDLRLVVVEGRVALGTEGKPVEVNAGEISVISDGTTTAPVRVGDLKPIFAWLGRFLVFQATPVSEVARQLEAEYGVAVEVADASLASQTITGWYADQEFEDVFAVVCGVLQTDCSLEGGIARIGPPVTPEAESPTPF